MKDGLTVMLKLPSLSCNQMPGMLWCTLCTRVDALHITSMGMG
jgi:hypothetical protein